MWFPKLYDMLGNCMQRKRVLFQKKVKILPSETLSQHIGEKGACRRELCDPRKAGMIIEAAEKGPLDGGTRDRLLAIASWNIGGPEAHHLLAVLCR